MEHSTIVNDLYTYRWWLDQVKAFGPSNKYPFETDKQYERRMTFFILLDTYVVDNQSVNKQLCNDLHVPYGLFYRTAKAYVHEKNGISPRQAFILITWLLEHGMSFCVYMKKANIKQEALTTEYIQKVWAKFVHMQRDYFPLVHIKGESILEQTDAEEETTIPNNNEE